MITQISACTFQHEKYICASTIIQDFMIENRGRKIYMRPKK